MAMASSFAARPSPGARARFCYCWLVRLDFYLLSRTTVLGRAYETIRFAVSAVESYFTREDQELLRIGTLAKSGRFRRGSGVGAAMWGVRRLLSPGPVCEASALIAVLAILAPWMASGPAARPGRS